MTTETIILSTCEERAERLGVRLDVLQRAQRDGVTVFMPAYNEAANLPNTVSGLARYLALWGCSYNIVIVNDGSIKDETRPVAEQLAATLESIVLVEHHAVNLGYGDALRTGIRAALDRTDNGLLMLMDSDGQFKPQGFATLLTRLVDAQAKDEHVALSIGIRTHRADGLKRKLMGRGWHWLSLRILGVKHTAWSDTDCGLKMFERRLMDKISGQLVGHYAAVSPEILARSLRSGFKLTEVSVPHYPREAGEQTGSDLKVVVKSLRGLWDLRRAFKREDRQK